MILMGTLGIVLCFIASGLVAFILNYCAYLLIIRNTDKELIEDLRTLRKVIKQTQLNDINDYSRTSKDNSR